MNTLFSPAVKSTGMRSLCTAGLFLFTSTAFSQTYCTPPAGANCSTEAILTVIFADIDHDSGCGSGYENYTSTPPAHVELNEDYLLYLDLELAGTAAGVWIDYNHDGNFSAEEFTDLGSSDEDGQGLIGEVRIPNTAMTGSTRMRIKTQLVTAVGPNSACFGPAWNNGETEDYTVVISGTMGTPQHENTSASLYPNPAKNSFTVATENSSTVESIEIMSISGQKVLEHNINGNEAQVDISQLPSGLYITRIVTDRGILVKRLVKE